MTLRPLNTRRSRSAAFTLVELVASIMLISIAFPPLAIAMRDGVIRQAGMNQRIIARWLAHARIEQIIADRHSTNPNRGYANILTANYAAESPVSGFPAFSRSVSITETTQNLSTAGTGYKVVTVTVTWADAQRGSTSLQLQTVLTDY